MKAGIEPVLGVALAFPSLAFPPVFLPAFYAVVVAFQAFPFSFYSSEIGSEFLDSSTKLQLIFYIQRKHSFQPCFIPCLLGVAFFRLSIAILCLVSTQTQAPFEALALSSLGGTRGCIFRYRWLENNS